MNLEKIGKISFVTLILAILVTSMISIMTPTRINAQGEPAMQISPIDNTYFANATLPGTRFTVNATLQNATGLNTWQVQIEWTPGILNCTNMTIPTDSIFLLDIPAGPIIDNDLGRTTMGATQLLSPPVSGSGVLATIEFEILRPGVSQINYSRPYGADTYLLDVDFHDINATLEDASFEYIDPLSVTISPPGETQVNSGDTVTYTATASNGAMPYAYQWFFKYPNNTEVVTGVTTSTFTTDPIVVSGVHRITVQVTDFAGGVINASATARVRTLSVKISPQDKIVDINDNVTFTVTCTGGLSPYKIVWYRNATLQPSIENDTTATFTFNTVGNEVIKVSVTEAGGTNVNATTKVIVLPAYLSSLEVNPADGATTIYTNMTQELLVNITVTTVTDLWSWQVNLTWDPAVLDFIDVTVPTDYVFAEAVAHGLSTLTTGPVEGTGNMMYGIGLFSTIGDRYTFNGTGVLAQVRFSIIRFPESTPVTSDIGFLNKYSDTFMLDYDLNTIAMHSEENMTFSYVHAPVVEHHVAAFGGSVFWTYSNASILADSIVGVAGGPWSISLNAYGNAGSTGFVNVTMPRASLEGPWQQVLVNGTNVNATALYTTTLTNTYVYITFPFSSTITIQVVGTIPEPLPMLMVTLVIGSLIAAVLVKRFPKRKQIL